AFFRYPDIFGFAGAMSPSLWFAERAIFPVIEEAGSPPGRLYLDIGTAEGEEAVNDARRLRDLLHEKGYSAEGDFRYVEDEGGGHNEKAWSARLADAIGFLLGPVVARV
ncbi:MAG: alpha/beta hydrolase-fold protein, partial [Geminicoccaceae bacterium]